jgi:hypothetical protein
MDLSCSSLHWQVSGMNYISRYFVAYEGAFTQSLIAAGFSSDQARQFVAITVSCISHTIKDTDLKKIVEILLSDDPSQLLNEIDDHDIASSLGMEPGQVSSGLAAISPVMKLVLIKNSNQIVDAAASLAWTAQRKLNTYGFKGFVNTH